MSQDKALEIYYRIAREHWKFSIQKKGKKNSHATILSETLFSPDIIQQHAWFTNKHCKNEILECILQKKKEILVFFFNDKTWFDAKCGDLCNYAEWCKKFYNSDYSVSSLYKFEKYLRFKIDERREKGATSCNTSIEDTCRELYHRLKPTIQRLAAWQGYTECANNSDRFGPLGVLKAQLDKDRKDASSRARDHNALCRATKKRFTIEEHDRIQQQLWAPISQKPSLVSMRQLLEHCLQNASGRRGEDIRSIRLSMLFSEIITEVKPASLHIIGCAIYDPKERKDPIETLISFVRAKKREICPVAALAVYLVYIVDIHGHQLLQCIRRDLEDLNSFVEKDQIEMYHPKWRNMYLLYASDPFTPMSYTTHNNDVTRTFDTSGVFGKRAKTHIYRTEVKARHSHAGVGELESDRHMGFRHQTSTDVYGRASHTISAILPTAGWDGRERFECSWESDGSTIPLQVLQNVLPGLDTLLIFAKNVQKKVEKRYGTSRNSPTGDASAISVLKLLIYLRKVFIEDSLYFLPKYPSLPAYSCHHIFKNQKIKQVYEIYKEAEERSIHIRESSYKQEMVVPDSLMEQVNQVVAAASKAAEAAITAVASTKQQSEEKCKVSKGDFSDYPLPPLSASINDIKIYYNEWRNNLKDKYDAHRLFNNGKLAWNAIYGKSQAASKRYTDSADFFKFLDALNPNAVEQALNIIQGVSVKHSIKPSNMVKVVFYHMVRPNTECSSTIKEYTYELSNNLREAGLFYSTMDTKQDHSKKYKT